MFAWTNRNTLRFDFGSQKVGRFLTLSHAGLSLGCGGVKLHKTSEVGLGFFDDLDLADADVLQGKDAAASLFDGFADGLGNELSDQLLELTFSGFLFHDAHHLLTDGSDLGGLGVTSGLLLVVAALGEGDAGHAELVAVEGLYVDSGLDEGVPLADHGAEVVSGDIHAIEVGKAVSALDVFAAQFDFAVELILIALEVSKVNLVNSVLQGIVRKLCRMIIKKQTAQHVLIKELYC